MIRIFVYEWVTAGGWLRDSPGFSPPASLVREGRAMLTALATDFAHVADVEVVTVCREHALGQPLAHVKTEPISDGAAEADVFARLAASATWTVVIAPEFERILYRRCQQVERLGGRLLGPDPDVVQLCSDKQATAEHLARCGVPIPDGQPLAAGESCPGDFCYPAVWKPIDGAGSLDVRLVEKPKTTESGLPKFSQPGRLERFCGGTPASVALLFGPEGIVALPACRQRLVDQRTFAYQGGSLPLAPPLAARAEALARRAGDSLPPGVGYLGIDLVLGADQDGSEDVVIEINPRLTTSYVGLREASQANLAATLLAIACGQPIELAFTDQPVHFDADGRTKVG